MLCLMLFLLSCCTGKGSRVSFVLNQDFHSGYANENSTAFSILASNVKREVRCSEVFQNDQNQSNTRGILSLQSGD